MTTPPITTNLLPVPDDATMLRDALDGLSVGLRACTCPAGYHSLWGVFKAVGVHLGIYAESTGLAETLRPLLPHGARVLFAGTADTTALQLFAACSDAPAALRFTIADRCPAPLERVSAYAAAHGLQVGTVEGDLGDLPPGEGWDLAFLHYTLSFADTATRRRILGAIARGLSPDGHVILVAKFGAKGSASIPGEAWLAPLRPRIERLLADRPEALAAVADLLPAYARHRGERTAVQPSVEALEADLAAVGLTVRDRRPTTRSAWTRSERFPTVDNQETMLLDAVHAR